MPRNTYISADGSTYSLVNGLWVGTRDFVGISFSGGTATLEFSGSTSTSDQHASIRHMVSTAGMPSDVAVTAATATNVDARNNVNLTTSSFSDGQTLYVKAAFYSGSSGTGNFNIQTTSLTKSGNNATSSTLIWRPVREMHVWDGSAWRRIDAEQQAKLTSAYGTIVFFNDWTVTVTFDRAAGSGYWLSVRQQPFDIEYGPFDVSGLTGDSIQILGAETDTYHVELFDASSVSTGPYFTVVPT